MPSQPKYERSFEIRVIGKADTAHKDELLTRQEILEGMVRHCADNIKQQFPELTVLNIQTILDNE